ncbi:MAG: hypothetical protein E7055_18070 [Lentisphaerae bacterium]|nr:hypothetical protein [Lentisphaerota bacterium]
MPDTENWEEYGFPDDLFFRPMYRPSIGIIKALNERLEAVNMETLTVPDYFAPYQGSQSFLGSIESKILNELCYEFVNPEKVPSAKYYSACFWDPEALELAAAGGVEENIFRYSPLMPQFPVKWAQFTYNLINLLRYVPTTTPRDWPDKFEYTDLNSTFAFKAP